MKENILTQHIMLQQLAVCDSCIGAVCAHDNELDNPCRAANGAPFPLLSGGGGNGP